MKRGILISLMVISAASMLVIGGLAAFTDSGTGTGSTSAGDVTVDVTSVVDSTCAGLGDGDTCTVTANVDWTGSLDANIVVDAAVTNESVLGCWEIDDLEVSDISPTVVSADLGGFVTTLTAAPAIGVAANSTELFTVAVIAKVAGGNCAGSTADIVITATATEV